jgi:uncharacterized caspase-like protein
VIFADLSFPGGRLQSETKSLVWEDGQLQTKGRMVVVGSAGAPVPSVMWDAGQHGWFTYQFLRAIRGQADTNHNGWVDLGEVLTYLHKKPSSDSMQPSPLPEVVVFPEVDPAGPVGSFPLVKVPR